MEYLEILNSFISTLGFPIVVCAVLFWYINKQEERHKAEMDKITVAIDNNTEALGKILNKIGGEYNEP